MVGLTVIVVKEQYQDSKRKKKSKALLWQKVKMLLDGYFTEKCLKTLTLHVNESVHTLNVSVFKYLAVK